MNTLNEATIPDIQQAIGQPLAQLADSLGALVDNVDALHGAIAAHPAVTPAALALTKQVSAALSGLHEDIRASKVRFDAVPDPTSSLENWITQLQGAGKTISLFTTAGTSADPLFDALQPISAALSTLGDTMIPRIQGVAASLLRAKLDPASMGAIAGAAEAAKEVGNAAHVLFGNDVLQAITSQATAIRRSFSGDGAALKTSLLPSLQSVKTSVDSICQSYGVPAVAQLGLALQVLEAVGDHVPGPIYDALATGVPAAQFESIADQFRTLAATLARAQTTVRSEGSGGSLTSDGDAADNGGDITAEALLLLIAVACSDALTFIGHIERLFPMSLSIDVGGHATAEAAAFGGWAAAAAGDVGIGVNVGTGVGTSLSIVNFTALIMAPATLLLGVSLLIAEGLILHMELDS